MVKPRRVPEEQAATCPAVVDVPLPRKYLAPLDEGITRHPDGRITMDVPPGMNEELMRRAVADAERHLDEQAGEPGPENPYLDEEWLARLLRGERLVGGRATGKTAAMAAIRDGIRRGTVYVRDGQGRETRMEGYIEVGRMERRPGDDVLVATSGAITVTQSWPEDRQVVATLFGMPWTPALVLPLPRLRLRQR